jgi:hypothetical protein
VVDDLGQQGRVYREADVETTDLETVILDLLEGQYKNPVRVVAFNTAETDLAVVPVDDVVSSHALVGEGGRVRVIPAGESWPVQEVKSVLKEG